jgi:hypothetical protein
MSEDQMLSVEAGQRVYSRFVLALYDAWVLGFSNQFLWRCPTSVLRQHYDRNVSARHLDIGVGTGYFLHHARWPAAEPELTLLDLNANSLQRTSARIARFHPTCVQANALQPFPELPAVNSVGLCYLLHCLPGTLAEKAAVIFDHVKAVATPGARIFGATIVQGNAPRSRPAQKLMDVYNAKGIFSNDQDTIEDLETVLEQRFVKTSVQLHGCVTVFEAEHPG